ncbi:hypothetical protein [Streptomyces griseosporeus]|uniref:hypothetical protein n=1 Tax=Streptomyces griseosporeus TaxID=1910 RepID=UPI0036FC9F2E
MAGIEDVMDFLVDHRAANVPPGFVAEQLESMAWIVDIASGIRLREVAKQWLTCGDPFRVAVAAALSEGTYLYDTFEELAGLAAPLKERFPSMAADLDAWLTRARESYERRDNGTWWETGGADRTTG